MTTMKWIERTLAGDLEAYELIFNQYKNLVFKTAFLLLDNPNEADDALQEVFLKAYRSLGAYKPSKGAFSTWIYRITVNHCLNRRRRLQRFTPLRKSAVEGDLQAHASFEAQISENQALQAALQRLSKKLRAVIVLRYFLDLSYAEIAQVLDIPMGTVKSRLHLAIEQLRQQLQSETVKALPAREVSE